jgi:hypothetical protein
MEVKLNLFENVSWLAVTKIVAYLSSSDQICALQISAGDSGGLSKKKCRKPIKHSGVRGGGGWGVLYVFKSYTKELR